MKPRPTLNPFAAASTLEEAAALRAFRYLKLGIPLGAGATVGLYLTISGIIADQVTRVRRESLRTTPADVGLPFEPVAFTSHTDHLPLKGWLIPASPERPWIVSVHGRSGHRASPDMGLLELAQGLQAKGYNLLMFDLRGHGESAGSRHSAGFLERRDVLGAMDLLRSRDVPMERIGLLGFSLGAVACLLAAAETPDLLGVVADSAFADIQSLLRWGNPRPARLPLSLFRYGILALWRLLYGVDFTAARPLRAVQRIPFPVLFIHGARDRTIPPSESERLWLEAHHPASSLWIASGAAHGAAYVTQPEEYLQRVDDCFRGVRGGLENGRA